ncbi:hypothetical protein WJX81_006276 [Elliptochloris bilobata]|uniref:UBL3-like ubiquitin domain-containing protein n=1 Tax=Elliptochloris bilobata TaxID=381761 RepID=A0AAW1S0I7_9CHLO
MSVDLRCRLTQGDIGPFPVARTLSVQGVKEQLLRRWPQEGPLRAEQPGSVADLKLIMGGKFLDNGDMLEDVLASHFGEGNVVTLHVVEHAWISGLINRFPSQFACW